MRRGLTVVLTALAALLAGAPPAGAGGWWSSISVEERHYGVGEVVRARTDFLFASIEEAALARAHGHFYAYLIRGFDQSVLNAAMSTAQPEGWWSLGGAVAVPVGEVALSGWDGNWAQARVRFTVPDVEPGWYRLMFCDLGCASPLGDVIPTAIQLWEHPSIAQLARKLDGVASRASKVRTLRAAISDLDEEVAAFPDAPNVASLTERVARLERQLMSRQEPATAPWWAFVGWFLLGVGTALAAVSHTRRRRRSRVDDGLEQLLAEEQMREKAGHLS